MDPSPIGCIFTVSRATARTTAYLRCRRPRGHGIHCKYAVVLFCGRARARRSADGAFSPPWGVLWSLEAPTKVVSSKKLKKLSVFLQKKSSRGEARKSQKCKIENRGRSRVRIAWQVQWILTRRSESIVNHRSPWP